MASVGHIAVGLVAARIHYDGRVPRASSIALWSALSLLPDIDVVGFALGVAYSAPWGHRGATHSLTLSVAFGVAIALAARLSKRAAVRTALIASAVLASHALLDTMTDGGLGCALLWPFDLDRYFAPWRPIPVAPIGFDFFSPAGGIVALAELLLFCPALLVLRPGRIATTATGFLLALWLASVSLLAYSGATRDAITGFVLREDTAYAPGFSESAFRTVTSGQSEDEVRRRLGSPFREFWFYTSTDPRPPDERPVPRQHGCLIVRFEAAIVVAAHELDACRRLGIASGVSLIDVNQRLGTPTESCWQYSWSPRGAHYRQRVVCFSNTQVHIVVRKWS